MHVASAVMAGFAGAIIALTTRHVTPALSYWTTSGELVFIAILADKLPPDQRDRARLIGQADAALAVDTAFIPIARPLRWSLVALRLRQWRPNTRAWHPLNRLRDDTN